MSVNIEDWFRWICEHDRKTLRIITENSNSRNFDELYELYRSSDSMHKLYIDYTLGRRPESKILIRDWKTPFISSDYKNQIYTSNYAGLVCNVACTGMIKFMQNPSKPLPQKKIKKWAIRTSDSTFKMKDCFRVGYYTYYVFPEFNDCQEITLLELRQLITIDMASYNNHVVYH